MRSMQRRLSALALAALIANNAWAEEKTPEAAPTPVFAVGEHSAAYHADKKVGGGKIAHVVGKNPEIQVRVDVAENGRRVLVSVPADKFVSGSGRRDKDVARFLGGSKTLPVLISTGWLSAEEFSRLASGSEGTCAGEIEIQGVRKSLALKVKGDGKVLWVEAATAFSQLGLEPPKVGPFGWFGSVLDPLTLTAQIQIDKSEVPVGAISAPVAPRKVGKKK